MSKIRILFLASNPRDTDPLRLIHESQKIESALNSSKLREKFDFIPRFGVRVDDLQTYLLHFRPHIVHISGHGEEGGLVLEDKDGYPQIVRIEDLARLFELLKDNIQCVVLNACFTDIQAKELSSSIDCVVGISKKIADTLAIEFAPAFYLALGYGKSTYESFQSGCIQIGLVGSLEGDKLKLFNRNHHKRLIVEDVDVTTIPNQIPDEEREFFVGRKKEMEQITSLLQDQKKLCIIRGLPGVGKTLLANMIAFNLASYYSDGVLWGNLGDNTSTKAEERVAPLINKFAAAYGMSLPNEFIARSDELKRLLGAKNCLIVLDNVQSKEEIKLLVPLDASCTLLITTQDQRIHKNKKVFVHLPPLDDTESLELLERLLGSERLQSAGTKEQAKRIVEHVSGHAMALNIIGSFLISRNNIDISEYADRFAERIEFFNHLAQKDSQLSAAIDPIYQQFTFEQRELFARLALFTSLDFSTDVLPTVTSRDSFDSKDIMGDFTELALVSERQIKENLPAPTNLTKSVWHDLLKRYQIHALISWFASTKFTENRSGFMEKITNYYIRLTKDFTIDGFRLLDLEWGALQNVIDWCLMNNQMQLLLKLTENLTYPALGKFGFIDARGYWSKGLAIIEQILASGIVERADERNWLTLKAGVFALRIGQIKRGQRFLQQVIDLTDRASDSQIQKAVAYALGLRAELFMYNDQKQDHVLNDLEQAKNFLNKSLLSDVNLDLGWIKLRMATVYAIHGESELAIPLLEETLSLLPTNDSSLRVSCHNNLGNLYDELGRTEEAKQQFHLAENMAVVLGDNRLLAGARQNLGNYAEDEGRFEDAERYYTESLEGFKFIGSWSNVCRVQNNLSYHYSRLREPVQLMQYVKLAHATFEQYQLSQSDPEVELNIHLNHARLLIISNDFDEAQQWLNQVQHASSFAEEGFEGIRVEYLLLQAELYLKQQKFALALDSIKQAVFQAEAANQIIWLGASQRLKSEIEFQAGETEEIVRTSFQESINSLANYPYEKAKTDVAWGKYEVQLGNYTVAKLHFEIALAIFKHVNALKDIQEVNELLSQV